MPTDVLRLGPFVGGLNISSDPSAIADSELAECVNMEMDLDGSLKSRPAIHISDYLSVAWTEHIKLLGTAVFSTGTYIIGSNSNGVFRNIGGTWGTITTTFEASCMVQYDDKIWIIAKPGSANPGGTWSPAGGFTAQANLPKGGAAVVYKERLFVTPGRDATTDTSRLIFSEPANFLDYNPSTAGDQASPGVDFIDISKGDGTKLIDLVVYRGNLLLFKEDSTYVLAYETSPTDAVVENISPVLGVTKDNCAFVYENTVYILHEGNVFEIVNYDFNKINVKCPFAYDGGVPSGTNRVEEFFIGRVGDRMIVRYFNKIYVYGLRTRVWSEWKSSSDILHNFGPIVSYPVDASVNQLNAYYAGSSLQEHKYTVVILDGHNSTNDENDGTNSYDITCSVTTKNYDIAASHLFKRLFWWGADILSNRDVTGTAQPIVFSFQVLWGDLNSNGVTWGQLNTWGQPTTSIPAVTEVVPTGTGTLRRFIKFLRALRFRQINFNIKLLTNGTTTDGPARLYTITLSVKVKQTVGKAVN